MSHQDKFKTRPYTRAYDEGWNRIFGTKKQKKKIAENDFKNHQKYLEQTEFINFNKTNNE